MKYTLSCAWSMPWVTDTFLDFVRFMSEYVRNTQQNRGFNNKVDVGRCTTTLWRQDWILGFMLSLLLRSSVPGGDGGDAAVAAGRTRVAGRAWMRIAIFIEAPRRRPHTIPHVNWLLAPHFFWTSLFTLIQRQCHRTTAAFPTEKHWHLCNWPRYANSLTLGWRCNTWKQTAVTVQDLFKRQLRWFTELC